MPLPCILKVDQATHIASLRKEHNSEFEVYFLLIAHCFWTTIKLRDYKLGHCSLALCAVISNNDGNHTGNIHYLFPKPQFPCPSNWQNASCIESCLRTVCDNISNGPHNKCSINYDAGDIKACACCVPGTVLRLPGDERVLSRKPFMRGWPRGQQAGHGQLHRERPGELERTT